MEVSFYTKSTKPFGKGEVKFNWAQIFFPEYADDAAEFEEGPNTFNEIKDALGKVSIFGNDYSNEEVWENELVLNKITGLCQENHSEVVLVTDYAFFMKALKRSSKDEMEANLMITEDRELIYYATIGTDKCAMLVVYESLCQYE